MLFRKRKKPDPDSLLQGNWRTAFRWFDRKRFAKEESADYAAWISKKRLQLQIRKASCFAWVTSPFQYSDFVLEAGLSIDRSNGHSAAGFVLRYNNEENFYYFMLSNRGMFRFDVLFNKNPLHLIEWTPYPQTSTEILELRLIARGDSFSFYLDDEWIAELSDATLRQGFIGFAAQNYEERAEGDFFLHHIEIESRPIQVEKQFLRWTGYLPAKPERRIALARTFNGMGKYAESVVQLREALSRIEGGPEEHLLLARSYAQLKAYQESLESFDRCLELDPGQARAAVEKADVLFLQADFLKSRDYLESILPRFPDDAQLRNLLGSSEYSLGNWQKAAAHYCEALRLDPQNAIYLVNLARCQERAGDGEAAVSSYLEAAGRLFAQERYDELSFVLARTAALVREGSEQALALKSYEAKMLFHEGKKRQAELILRELIDSGYPDSGVHFLYALLLIDQGKRKEADAQLARAVEIEPAFPLYWLRLAENRFLLGEDPTAALERAFELDPEGPWINNLRGQVLLKERSFEQSLSCFQKALEAAPEKADIYRNYAESLIRLGRAREALSLLSEGIERAEGTGPEKARLYNQRGNCLVELKEFATALRDYEKALELVPDDRDYMENCAACCLELDMIKRAEELLNRLLEGGESPSLYNLIGNLAAVTGEYERARLAYLEGLKLEEGNLELRCNLLSLYIDAGRYEQAKELLAQMYTQQPVPRRLAQLESRLRERFEIRLACSACGREWWVPKQVPPQPAFTIRGEPPGEAPAGRCGDCGGLYCIACASEHVRDGKLMCPTCGRRLRLSEDPLKFLLLRYVDAE